MLELTVGASRPVTSWWTPGRVSFALHNYVELAAEESLHAVEAVYDIDHAIAQLPPRLRSISDRYFRQEWDQSELARSERVSQQRVSSLASEAREIVTEFLCRGVV